MSAEIRGGPRRRMPIEARAVLDTLDAANRENVFPVMDNGYVYPAATRLTVLSDAERWAIVFDGRENDE